MKKVSTIILKTILLIAGMFFVMFAFTDATFETTDKLSTVFMLLGILSLVAFLSIPNSIEKKWNSLQKESWTLDGFTEIGLKGTKSNNYWQFYVKIYYFLRELKCWLLGR